MEAPKQVELIVFLFYKVNQLLNFICIYDSNETLQFQKKYNSKSMTVMLIFPRCGCNYKFKHHVAIYYKSILSRHSHIWSLVPGFQSRLIEECSRT